MPSNKKHYVITAISLGLIAAASGGIIAAVNLITRDQIKKNEEAKIKTGLVSIFGNDVEIKEDKYLDSYKYVNHYYSLNNDNYVFRTTGSNSYGKISLLLGFSLSKEEKQYNFVGLYVVVDEQTYASTLEDKYIAPVNDGSRNYEDVSCGATFGAKLVRDMINEASDVAQGYVRKD